MRLLLSFYGVMVLVATAAAFGGAVTLAGLWLAVMTAALVMLIRDYDRAQFLVPDRIPATWA